MSISRYLFKKSNGFTLIEIIVGMSIMTIVLGLVYLIFRDSINLEQYISKEDANISDERLILISISNELRNATEINSPVFGDGELYSTISYRKEGDLSDRAISIGFDNYANTVVFTMRNPQNPNEWEITQTMGMGRVKLLQFQRDVFNPRKITIILTMEDSSNNNLPGDTVSTVIYTLNQLTE